jgi:hypothetical protein
MLLPFQSPSPLFEPRHTDQPTSGERVPLTMPPLQEHPGCWPPVEAAGGSGLDAAADLRPFLDAPPRALSPQEAYRLALLLGAASLFGLDEVRDRSLSPEVTELALQASHAWVGQLDGDLHAFVPPGPPPRPNADPATQPGRHRHASSPAPAQPPRGLNRIGPAPGHADRSRPDPLAQVLLARLQLWLASVGIDIAYGVAETQGELTDHFDHAYMSLLDRIHEFDLRLWELRGRVGAVVANHHELSQIRDLLRKLDEASQPWWLEEHPT